jgi:hypothetical protein
MSMVEELRNAEARLARMINRRADAEDAEARADDAQRRADKRERIRQDDLRCRDLAAEYQSDFAAHGVEPPMPRADEWANQYERRLLSGLQRRLSPRSDLADPQFLGENLSPAVFASFAQMIRDEAGREAKTPSRENLPQTVADSRARFETTGPETGQRQIEWRARESFIKDMSRGGRRVLRFIGKGGDVIFGPAFDKAR